MTYPKGWKPLNQIADKAKQEDPTDVIYSIFFIIDIIIFLGLILFNHRTLEDFEIFIFLVYYLISLFIIFVYFYLYYKKHSVSEYFTRTKRTYRLYRSSMYILIFAVIGLIINYYLSTKLNLRLVDFLSETIFGWNASTFIFFLFTIYSQLVFVYAIPSFVANEFYYYQANETLRQASKNNDLDKKIKDLTAGLESYNKYIQRRLKRQINSIDKICSTIISKSNLDIDKEIDELSNSFNDNCKLNPLRAMSKLLNDEHAHEILAKGSAINRMVPYSRAIAPIVGVAITVIIAIIRAH